MSTKLIREGRMGLYKSFKTGAVVGTYPKPMLVFNFDIAGLDVIPPESLKTEMVKGGMIPFNVTAEEVETIVPDQFEAKCGEYNKGAAVPKVLCVDFSKLAAPLNLPFGTDFNALSFKIPANSVPMQSFIKAGNALHQQKMSNAPFPWKTFVFDNFSSFSDIVIYGISAVNPNTLGDARVWAPMVGSKVKQAIETFGALPCHAVFLMHTKIEKNEQTGAVTELPNIYSGVRDIIGNLFSALFYSTKEGGKPVVYTSDRGYVRGLGARWPVNLPAICAPDYNSIYGKELGTI